MLLCVALLVSVSARAVTSARDASNTTGDVVTIDNTQPRRTTDGQLMDAHDGNIVQWQAGGRYYYYAMGYQNCSDPAGIFSHVVAPYGCPGVLKRIGACGFRTDHAVNVYSSPDLTNWTFEGDALPTQARPKGVYFRPKVVYNRRTSEYVLWINFLYERSAHQTPLGAYPNATYLVGASKSPVGPFTIATPSAHLEAKGAGDLAILVDGDDAYVVYDAWSDGHSFQLQQLDADFYDVRLPAVTPAQLHASGEAPMLFKRRGWYYLIVGSGCASKGIQTVRWGWVHAALMSLSCPRSLLPGCFCPAGGSARVFVAQHPLGTWTDTKVDLNPKRRWSMEHVIPAQNNDVFQARVLQGGNATSETEYILTADMWHSAADHLKSHDRQFWAPLRFDDTVTPPTIAALEWTDSFTLQLA